MYFKKLELLGFKSFAEKTILNFEPGITAVVGPNGCGKSNIFDAIRWVLGEQSVKELRGGSMEDCIFNGTDKKPALGFAEVNLTFSNESKTLPIEYGEVTVTRRLFRSGESEYLLNKTVVRLKDILELFMGTGIGAEAYSLVQQGKVDLIVNAKPEERRMIIDEAAGITKYKSKKKEALNKLKDTENNLLRINDIIVEVKRQIASLERQANKARKYKGEFEKLKDLEVVLARHQIGIFSSQQAEINKWLDEYHEKESEINSELGRLQSILLLENEHSSELERKINDVYSDDIKLDNQIEINDRQVGFNEERIANIDSQKGRLDEQRLQLTERCRTQREKVNALNEALSALKGTLQNNVKELEERQDNLTDIADAIKEAKNEIKYCDEYILTLTSRQVNVTNELTEIMKEFEGYRARKRRLDMENAKVCSEKQEVDNRLQSICEDIENCVGKIDDLKNQRESKIASVDKLKEQCEVLTGSIDEMEKKRLFLKSQKEFIDKLQVQYKDIPDPVVEGTLLTTTAPVENNKGIIGKVKGVHQLDNARLKALKNNFPQFDNADLYEIICETKFIELDPQLIAAHIENLTRDIDGKLNERQKIQSEIQSQENVILSITHSIHDLEKVLSRYEAQKNEILEESSKLSGELDILNGEIEEAKQALTNLKAKEDELTRSLEEVNQEIQSRQNTIKERRNLITAKTQEREETSVAIAQLETEIESADEKEQDQLENIKLFEGVLANDQQEIQRLEQEEKESQVKRGKLISEISELQAKIEELKTKKSSLMEVLNGYKQQKTESISRIKEVQSKVRSIEEKAEDTKGNMHKYQLKAQEISFSEKSTKDRLLQSYKVNFDELTFEDQDQEVNVEEVTGEIERLKKRCESFGSVNLVAIEEFDELKARFEFLTKQQSDMITARESLHSTINKINRTTRQLFLDTFTKVSEEFRVYFRMLFGGGEAQLMLVDPEHVLESGIDIVARPPGKKLQNISLLSGGEKSLAAIALIFGVFKVRPSPFCILDEIDAALDESNVGRFGYLLKDFSKIAQFIVITHNKKTITNAKVMYGITMQETGVSRVVSVKFNEEEEKQEAQEKVPAGV